MKLSKQERIGAFVIAVIVILAVGIFVFIKPRFEAISTTTASLENKQQEYVAALEKQATKDTLKQQVLDAYEEGQDLADMFFEELTTYQADAEFRAFLEQCEAKILVEDLSVSEPTVSTLAPTYFTEPEVTYALKSYVTQGLEPTEEELAAANRFQILQNTLGSAQDVGSITITFTVSAIDQEELIKFCDEVNSYFKEEDGTQTRKAMKLGGFTIEYPLIENEYTELIDEIKAEAETAGTKELYKNYNMTVPASETSSENTDAEGNSEQKLEVSDNLFSVSTTLTFYSVERMQDPTDQLEQQDSVAF